MASRLQGFLRVQTPRLLGVRAMSGGQLGDGVGKGGGGGGSVREAGGSFAKMEVAKEEQYFRQLQSQQFEKMRDILEDEVSHHELQIRNHQAAIEHHKKRIDRIHKRAKEASDTD